MHLLVLTAALASLGHIVNALPLNSVLQARQISNSTLQWSSCGDGTPSALQCARLQVPMNWANPSGPQISLSVSRVRATDNSSRIGSVIFNPGGPGVAATQLCYGQALGFQLFSKNLTSHFDIVCPDPRGVGQSNPIQCDADLWNSRQTIFPKDNASYQQMASHYKAFGESCLNLTGDLVRYVDTVSVARDFEALRVGLNEGNLNYLGISYGSQIGTTYAELFPENIRAMAIDGILDHSASKTYFLSAESKTYENVLNQFFSWCNATSECPLQGQNVSQVFDNLVVQANVNPIPAPDCLPTSNSSYAGLCFPNVTGEEIRLNTQGLLLFKDRVGIISNGWATLGQALSNASNGDATLLSTPRAANNNATNWQGLAIGCLDWHAFSNFADLKSKNLLTNSTAPHTQGAAQSYTYEAQCAGWPIPIANPQRTLNQTALARTPPILLVNSYYDPSTSYEWANSVKEQVPNSVLLTRNGAGHTSYFLGGEAAAAIDTYLIDGKLPAENAVVQT